MNASVQHDQEATRLRLARNPVAIECVRATAAFTNAHVEVVVFAQDRVFVAASSSGHGVMLPRAMNEAEAAIWDPTTNPGSANGCQWIAVPIRNLSGAVVGALSVRTDGQKVAPDGLHALARVVEAELADEDEHTSDFFHDVVHGQRDAVVVLSANLDIQWVSQGVGTLLGRTPGELMGRSAVDFLHADDLESTFDAVTRMAQGLEVYRVYVRLLNAADEYTPVEVTGNDLSSNPDVEGLVLSLRDAQQDQELGQAIDRSQRMSEAIVNGLRDGVIATDEFGAIVSVNDTARVMFDIDPTLSPAQVNPADFSLVALDGRPHDPYDESSTTSEVCCLVSPRGEVRYVTTSCQPIAGSPISGEEADDDSGRLGTVVVFSDITAEHHAAEQLRSQALHDQLTGLANRRQLEDRLNELAAASPPVNVAACFIDIDNFKLVNDNHGHRTGDQLVRIAAQRLAAQLRAGDLLVRQGGDEFVAVLLGCADLDEAAATAERCRAALAAPYTVGSQRFDLTGSVGVAMASGQLDPDLLLQHADLALYSAKDRGRNRVERFDAELADAVSIEEAQRQLLRSALEEDRLVMHFQPLVDTTTETIVGYEALARICTADGEILSPISFMESVASTSLMWDLDQAAFVLSCQAAALLCRIDAPVVPYMACNFASTSINHPDFLDFLDATVAEAGVDPSDISIELTESAAFEAGARGGASLAQLCDRGFRLALDDFGTGYSSLAHIRDLPISSIKVDRSFITRLGEHANERSIAEAVVNLARDLNLGVVAEGVETSDQLHHATTLGFSTIQGWHYARAMPLAECLQNLVEAATRPVGDRH